MLKINNYCSNEFQLGTLAQLQQNTLQNNAKIMILIPHNKGTHLWSNTWINITVFWDVTPCRLVVIYHYFRGLAASIFRIKE
jgi:hypothetical protein